MGLRVGDVFVLVGWFLGNGFCIVAASRLLLSPPHPHHFPASDFVVTCYQVVACEARCWQSERDKYLTIFVCSA